MKYDITCIKTDMIRTDIWEWLVTRLSREDYRIIEGGYLLTTYYLEFNNQEAEVIFNLTWGDKI